MLILPVMVILPIFNPDDPFSQNLCQALRKTLSKSSEIKLSDDPEKADIILFVDSYEDRQYTFVQGHEYFHKYKKKCFYFSQCDEPVPVLPGIYTNLAAEFHLDGWTDSFCYVDSYRKNPYLKPEPKAEKKYLFSFLGRTSHRVRKRLFDLESSEGDYLVENTDNFDFWAEADDTHRKFQKRYIEIALASKFLLCPRGVGATSYRFFESMEMGIAPVLISDAHVLPSGIDWDQFLIRVPESKAANIASILKGYESEWEERGRLAREAWEQYFDDKDHLKHIVSRINKLKGWDENVARKSQKIIKKTFSAQKRAAILFQIKCQIKTLLPMRN